MDRRDFLKNTAFLGALAAVTGCVTRERKVVDGPAPMQGFAAPALPEVRIGIVGVGRRAQGALKRLSSIPRCRIVAVCDLIEQRILDAQDVVVKNGAPKPEGFTDYDKMLDLDFDVVYNVTPWKLHAPFALKAMEKGKHVMIEVPAAMTLEECWALVETSERTQRHCMQLENCAYGEAEMLCLNLVRKGLLGDIVHCEGAYCHDLHTKNFTDAKIHAAEYPNGYTNFWRLRHDAIHKGNQYETHGFVPLCQYMNVNRGDRLDNLVSLESDQFTYEDYAKRKFPGTWKADLKVAMGDMNMTLLRTVKGRSILLQHDVSSPRPYSRHNLCQGMKGIFTGINLRATPEEMYEDGCPVRLAWRAEGKECISKFFDFKRLREIAEEHRHPLWKTAGEYAKLVGGHGGMDFLMDLRWTYCLQQGLPLDTDVYDLASVCSIAELSERSVRNGGMPQEIPDFTRGGWQTAKPLDIVDIDLVKLGLDPSKLKKDENALNV